MTRGVWLAVLPLVLAAGCTAPFTAVLKPTDPTPSRPATFMILGSVQVSKFDSPSYDDGTPCVADGGFTDIAVGGQVTVLDASGTKVAVGTLQAGQIHGYSCRFSFEVDGIPEGGSLYDVSIGREARGSITYSREQLDGPVQLSLS